MIYSPLSFTTRSADKPLATGAVLTAEGQALVYKLENGRQVVDVAAGVAGEVFAGFSNTQTSAASVVPTTATKVETLVIPASGIVTTLKSAIAGTAHAVNVADGTAIAVVSITGTAIDLGAANVGKTAKVVYRYTLTAAEARSLAGDVQPGGYAGNTYSQMGVAQEGVIYTDVFDTSVDFSLATSLKLEAGGMISDQTGTGVAISATVVSVPSGDYPFLGIQYRAL